MEEYVETYVNDNNSGVAKKNAKCGTLGNKLKDAINNLNTGESPLTTVV